MLVHRRTALIVWTTVILIPVLSFAGEESPPAWETLGKSLDGLLAALRGEKGPYTLAIRVETTGKPAGTTRIEFAYADDATYSVDLSVNEFSARLVRAAEETAIVVPAKKVMLASDSSAPCEAMNASALIGSIASRVPALDAACNVVRTGTSQAPALLLATLLGLREEPGEPPERRLVSDPKRARGRFVLRIIGDRLAGVRWSDGDEEVRVTIDLAPGASPKIGEVTGETAVVRVGREEFEAFVARALSRAAEILWTDSFYSPPADSVTRCENSVLRVRDGRRVLLLQGTPSAVGRAHGTLLADEVGRTVESTLFVVGLYYSVERKSWFLSDIRRVWKELSPHIDQAYVEELQALAEGAGLPGEEVLLASVFPEFFHCSGFALAGRATVDGKLYHGRILDYMTRIGLQRSAVVIVTRKDGAIPFANVSYAGFVGSVSGMNAQKIAIGEMGGGGQGKWAGVPMGFLVRSALERCTTLEEAKALFAESPRTCEYYYVFSDGKDASAVGVRAVPEEIEFVETGESHPLLPEAIEDCVVLSAGSRYRALVSRVRENYGRIDTEAALAIMKRPVAMESNLHSVLFVPQDLVFYVADAGARTPACDEPYARYDLAEMLKEMDALSVESRPSSQP
ncbi:MAG: C45 family peptidase [Planctomycetota bacterium]